MYLDFMLDRSGLFDDISEFFTKVKSLDIGIADIFDIVLVALVLFYLFTRFKTTRFQRLITGLIFLAVIYGVVVFFGLTVSSYILRFIFSNILLILIVVFQQEIRQIIERIGRSGFKNIDFLGLFSSESGESVNKSIVEICKAVQRMSDSKTGALIVMEKGILPLEVTETGTVLEAEISHELIGNIFFPNSPLHDGAAIVRDGRLFKAGCVLPLSDNKDISSDFGTRHRAALGMSENSDAMVVVVSEETGKISVALEGEMETGFDESNLREKLIEYLIPKSSGSGDKGFSKLLKKGKKK